MTVSRLENRLRDLLLRSGSLGLLEKAGLKTPLGLAWKFLWSRRLAREEMDVLRDYWSFKRRYQFLREGGERSDPTKKVLVVSLTDWVAQVKAESMLAKVLQLRGYTPVILTFRGCQRARRNFSLFGFREIVFFDDLIHRAAGNARDEDLRLGPAGVESVRSLFGWEYRGVDVGRHALSWVARTLRHGSLDLADPVVRDLVDSALRRSMAVSRAAEALIAGIQPEVALFLEKGYTPYGEIFDVLVNRKINTIQWLHAHRADALLLKRYTRETRHVHPFSLSAETWEATRQMPWTEAHERELMRELRGRYEEGTWFNRKFLQVGKQLKGGEEVRRQLGLDPSRKTAVIFSHVLWDATFFYGENLFDEYEEWLIETIRAACANPAVNWVVKLHPDYVWKLKQANLPEEVRDQIAIRTKIGRLPDHVKLMEPDTDISTFCLVEVTDYCLTVRGTIGIEMPCFGIPVFTAGTGRYSGLGFTIDSSTREEYLERLRHIQDFPPLSPAQTELAKRHAYALLKLRPCPFETFEMVQVPLEKLGHPLDHNIVIRAHSLRDLEVAPDLGAFADWVESDRLDFLNASLSTGGISPMTS